MKWLVLILLFSCSKKDCVEQLKEICPDTNMDLRVSGDVRKFVSNLKCLSEKAVTLRESCQAAVKPIKDKADEILNDQEGLLGLECVAIRREQCKDKVKCEFKLPKKCLKVMNK